MKSSRRPWFFSSSSATATVCSFNDHSASESDPIQTQPASEPIPVTVHIPLKSPLPESSAAVRIQSAYRSHMVRTLVRKIAAVDSEAKYWQRIIQRQDTVDSVRTSERERIKINEALMGLLFSLDSVPGIDPNVRELRRHVSRRIVGLQEILDAVTDSRVENWVGYSMDWDNMLVGIEKEICKEKGGGNEMERFCAEHLGLRCLERFLSDH
ncbi:BAG family molecular chaperone regulator 5, mitochondrial-like [Primulina huaijiensis]|uniref:BAG family molecular chaperone regulator 5, mitochondrial-like n=1 Tax=Primulina huaijiensis TaxID=1492673 RepID=UPI003CC75DB4